MPSCNECGDAAPHRHDTATHAEWVLVQAVRDASANLSRDDNTVAVRAIRAATQERLTVALRSLLPCGVRVVLEGA